MQSMSFLQNKVILIISPQSWGGMFLSKHHYAIELAKRGNVVYFLNPPDQEKISFRESISITRAGDQQNLFFISYSLFFPYILKYKMRSFFDWLMRIQTYRLLKEIGNPIDIVWSFDLENLVQLSFFESSTYTIFHPVDEPSHPVAIRAARGASIIFSVTREILAQYHEFKAPRYFINHGVTEDFINGDVAEWKQGTGIHIGYSGNLLRKDVDRKVLMEIIEKNPDYIFEFWGSYTGNQSNIGGSEDSETSQFINVLKNCSNVVLHGVVSPKVLAVAMGKMDAFLICYDILKDQGKGTNYHKVIEYIATGRAIISNNITTYHSLRDLIYMTNERNNNDKLPALFKTITGSLYRYNSNELRQLRRNYARENTYSRQLKLIESLIESSRSANS